MAKINSRNKGNAFERLIANKLTSLFEGKLTFSRSPLSGGWDKKAQTGDIFPLEMKDTFPLIIEARKNKSLTLDRLLTENSIIDIWFSEKKKLYQDHATKYSLIHKPIIFIMSRNNFKPIVVVEKKSIGLGYLRPEWSKLPHLSVVSGLNNEYLVFELDGFLQTLNITDILNFSIFDRL
jgi:hypothetical protein